MLPSSITITRPYNSKYNNLGGLDGLPAFAVSENMFYICTLNLLMQVVTQLFKCFLFHLHSPYIRAW